MSSPFGKFRPREALGWRSWFSWRAQAEPLVQNTVLDRIARQVRFTTSVATRGLNGVAQERELGSPVLLDGASNVRGQFGSASSDPSSDPFPDGSPNVRGQFGSASSDPPDEAMARRWRGEVAR